MSCKRISLSDFNREMKKYGVSCTGPDQNGKIFVCDGNVVHGWIEANDSTCSNERKYDYWEYADRGVEEHILENEEWNSIFLTILFRKLKNKYFIPSYEQKEKELANLSDVHAIRAHIKEHYSQYVSFDIPEPYKICIQQTGNEYCFRFCFCDGLFQKPENSLAFNGASGSEQQVLECALLQAIFYRNIMTASKWFISAAGIEETFLKSELIQFLTCTI